MTLRIGIPSRPLTVAALLASLGCQVIGISTPGQRVAAWEPDSTSTLAYTSYSGFTSAARLVISDSTAWRDAWDRLHATVQPTPARPMVDFAADAVLLVALGSRPSGGHGIRIDSLISFENGVTAYVTTTSPGPGCGVTLALTQPVHAVRIPRPQGPVAFHERTTERDCG